MNKEIDCILKNNTWELVNRPQNRRVVSSKWVFKRKTSPNGSVIYKARLVSRGFTQVQGIDYHNTYSPVVRYTTLRVLFALTVRRDYEIVHMDVECAYLQGDLEEELYLEQPKGFISKNHPGMVCKLNRAIYGLKQGGLAWNKKINEKLLKLNLKKSSFDPYVYYYLHEKVVIYVALFVDDLICVSNSIHHLESLKNSLATSFPIKYLADLTRCFGININRNREKGILTMDQQDYIQASLVKYCLKKCNRVLAPLDQEIVTEEEDRTSLSKEDIQKLKEKPYQRAIGTFMYLLQGTRPDLAFAISTLSKYNNSYTYKHWEAVKVFRYLLCLTFKRNPAVDLIGYGDASWASEPDGRSVTAYIFKMQQAAISWRCKRESTYALSSCDAEFQALTATIQDAVWLRGFLSEIVLTYTSPIPIMCDNTSTIDFSINQNYSPRTKHIIVKRGYAKQNVDLGEIIINYCALRDILADALTKALSHIKISKFVDDMGLKTTIEDKNKKK